MQQGPILESSRDELKCESEPNTIVSIQWLVATTLAKGASFVSAGKANDLQAAVYSMSQSQSLSGLSL